MCVPAECRTAAGFFACFFVVVGPAVPMRKRKELEAGPLHLWPYKKHHNYVFPFMRIEKPSTGQGKNVNNFTLPRDTHTHPRINSCMAFYEALTKKQANGQCSKNKFLCGHMRMFDLYIPCV